MPEGRKKPPETWDVWQCVSFNVLLHVDVFFYGFVHVDSLYLLFFMFLSINAPSECSSVAFSLSLG